MKTIFAALLLLLSSQAFASPSFCVGDTVVANMADGHFDVRIIELYNDATALVQYANGNTQVVALAWLSKPICEENGFRVNEAVVANMADGHFDVRIIELYSDASAQIKYANGNTQVVALAWLSKPISEESGFRVNESVVANMADGHFDVRIIELYANATALIQYKNGNTQVVDLAWLSAPIYCEGGCSGN